MLRDYEIFYITPNVFFVCVNVRSTINFYMLFVLVADILKQKVSAVRFCGESEMFRKFVNTLNCPLTPAHIRLLL